MASSDAAEAIQLLEKVNDSPLDPRTTGDLCDRLVKTKEFGYARQLYARLRADRIDDPALRLRFRQQQALCTYKDSDLTTEQGLAEAIRILDSDPDDPLRDTRDQETLGIAGAIYKRKWEVDGRLSHLERAAAYYLKGWRADPVGDKGYTGINAAYVLDLLAHLEEVEAIEAGADLGRPAERRKEARAIREQLVPGLTALYRDPERPELKNDWWFVATLAEACFGLQRYPEALTWLKCGRDEGEPENWKLESTARQLASLARLQAGPRAAWHELESSQAVATIREFLGDKADGALTAFTGRIGLALSGGGFRASFFHIGVLAKLAELDVLRHVEVLSCVSGGSIVGVQYYLELRKELRRRKHRELDRDCYIAIVERVERAFLDGVRTNIRTRVFKNPAALVRMIFDPGYSRTTRIGELFEQEFYSRVEDGAGGGPRLLKDLVVIPADGPADFHPRRDNWWRRAKVPILVVNATTLNTGHNWQFTATYMGEPPAYLEKEIDANYRLRRLYHRDAPPPYDAVHVGHAVAASACVPGLFRPIVLDGLYLGKVVRLVDGGVTDNQGIYGLLEQDCTVMLVSDASGQMDAEDDPSWLSTRVPLRANNILMAAVRSGNYRELGERRRSSRLRELMYVHLKKELETRPVTWRKAGAPASVPAELEDDPRPTSYGVPKAVQARLAAVRTDLDAFSERETSGLMLSGYLMTAKELPASIRSLRLSSEPPVDWSFRWLEREFDPQTRSPHCYAELLEELEVGRHRLFRGVRRSAPVKAMRAAWSRLRRKSASPALGHAEPAQR